MNIEDTLHDLFAHEAERRPESGPVLDAVHQRIAGQGRTTAIRTASAVGAAADVAAIAVTATVVATPSRHHAVPAGAAPPAPSATVLSATPTSALSPSPASSPAPSPSPTAPGSGSGSISVVGSPPPGVPHEVSPGGLDYSTINAGWLPGPATQDSDTTFNRPGFEERDWDVTVDGVDMDVIIWTEAGSLPSRMQATGGTSDYQSISINGHPGREFVSDNVTIVAFDLGDGTIAYTGPSVVHTTATVTSDRIAAIALHVADDMQFDQHDPIPGR